MNIFYVYSLEVFKLSWSKLNSNNAKLEHNDAKNMQPENILFSDMHAHNFVVHFIDLLHLYQ